MKLRNTSPLGDLTIVGIGHVESGAEFDAVGEIAESLLKQGFERVDSPKPKPTPKARASRTTKKEQQ